MIYKWQQRLSFDISECVGSKTLLTSITKLFASWQLL